MFAVLAVLIFVTWRNSRKRKAAAEEAQEKFVVGAEVMTSYGLFGTIKSIDGDQVSLESTPKTIVRVHRQSISKLVTVDDSDSPKSVEEAMARANAAPSHFRETSLPRSARRSPKLSSSIFLSGRWTVRILC